MRPEPGNGIGAERLPAWQRYLSCGRIRLRIRLEGSLVQGWYCE